MVNVICDSCGKEKEDAGIRWFKVYNSREASTGSHMLDVTVDELGQFCAGSAMVACSPKCVGKLIPTVIAVAQRHKEAMKKREDEETERRKKEKADYEASVKDKMIEMEARKRLKNK